MADSTTDKQRDLEEKKNGFILWISDIKANGSNEQKTFLAKIEKYISDMTPGKPMSSSVGAIHQKELWDLIKQILNNDPQEFANNFRLILAYFYFYGNDFGTKNVFSRGYVYRFSKDLTIPKDQINGYHRILNLLILTANPDSTVRKAGIKQVDFERTLAEGFTTAEKNKILGFYNV